MPSLTPNYGFNLPLVNDPIDADLWGTELNANWSSIDSLLDTATNMMTRALTTDTTTTIADRNKLLLVDATAGNVTITLPLAATAGDGFTIAVKKTDASTNTVIVDGAGAETIDGATTLTLGSQNNAVIIVSNGTSWYVESDNRPVAVLAVANGGTGQTSVSGVQASFGIFQHSQVFTSNGTFTPSAGVSRVYVEVWGAGGGGGGMSNAANLNSTGGGAGAYSAGFVDVTPSVGHTVTVGTGGAGGTSAGTNGSNGGTSSFAGASVTVTATGGAGGVTAASFNTVYLGGNGGTASNGALNFSGQSGDNALSNSALGTYAGGNGGNCPRGGMGGRASQTFSSANGGNGTLPGGGGAGTYRNSSGGAGANGMVIVYYP